MLEPFSGLFQNGTILSTIKVLYYTSYFFVPFFLAVLAVDLWVMYRRALFVARQTFVLLEIKLPKDVFKSPRAAEFFITGMNQSIGERNWYEKYWRGQMRAWFSLEIVAIDGVVHFFVWARKGHQNQIEANLYSQYPGIEIFAVPDYTLPFFYDPETTALWASEFNLTKPDAFPIKTYIDYGMDKDPKEEYKIDPLTPLLEFLGSLGKGNQVWLQIIIRSHKAEEKDPEAGWNIFKKKDMRWKEGAKKEIEDIIKKAKGEVGPDGKVVPGTGRPLNDVERETIKAIDRSVSKPGFDVGMRVIFTARKEIFEISNLSGIVGGITHFNSSMNGFKLARGSEDRYKNPLLVWLKRPEKRRNRERQHLLDAYKRRAYFFRPYKSPHFVLNTEELATLYHFPGGVSSTPTISRVESRKAEAPANIPT